MSEIITAKGITAFFQLSSHPDNLLGNHTDQPWFDCRIFKDDLITDIWPHRNEYETKGNAMASP